MSGKNKEKSNEGKYDVYGSTGVIAKSNQFTYEKTQILVARVGANAGFTHLGVGKYDVSDNTLILDVIDDVNLYYIYYVLEMINLNRFSRGGGQPLITAGQLKDVVIMLPSLCEQNRIVNTLQNFKMMCSDLAEGLPAEIEARNKQYEYYRDKLLAFEMKK